MFKLRIKGKGKRIKWNAGATFILFPLSFILFLMGCAQPEPVQVVVETPSAVPQTLAPTSTPAATATAVATLGSPSTPTPLPTSTVSNSESAIDNGQLTIEPPTPTVTQPATAMPDPNYSIQIAAVGDIMLDRRLGARIADGDVGYPFELMRPWLEPADITVGNFESALGDRPDVYTAAEGKSYPFLSPPEAARALAASGFDVVSLANNHALDYGIEAVRDGVRLLEAQGITTVGVGENANEARAPQIVEIDGVKLAFLAYIDVLSEDQGYDMTAWEATDARPGVAWGRPEIVTADVQAILPDVDHVIVLLHFGIEYLRPITPEQQTLARAAVDAGADLVIGHHAHVLQKVEEYNGGLIAYGLGNFAFDIDGDPSTMVLQAWLTKDGVERFELIPAVIEPGGRPRPATAEESREILGQIGR